MTGSLHYQSRIPGELGGYSTGATGPIVLATLEPLAIGSFTGTWSVFFATTSCRGARTYLLDDENELALVLDDRGGQIAGSLRVSSSQIPVASTASGDTAVLTGIGSGYTVSALRIQRSPTGRLSGVVTITSSWTADLELRSTALEP